MKHNRTHCSGITSTDIFSAHPDPELLTELRQTRARRPRPELIRLRVEIERTKCAIEAARNHFEQAVDPTLIDCYIYELKAAHLRYQFLLRHIKQQENTI